MGEPTPVLTCFRGPVRMLACNRIAPHNRSTSLQIHDAEVSATPRRDPPHAQTAHRHHATRSSDYPPNALWPAAALAGDCAARFSTREPPTQVRLRRETTPSGWC